MARFVAVSLLALLVLGVVTVVVDSRLAESAALAEAEARTAAFANNVVGRVVDAEVRAGRGANRETLDTLLRSRMGDGSIRHIKLWSADSRVIWSDEAELVGRVFPLGEEEQALFRTGGVVSGVSALEKEENRGESGEGPLLEVYAATVDQDGIPLVFESYWSTDVLAAEQAAVLTRTLPYTLAALLALLAVVLWLALNLARSVEAGQRERSQLLGEALAASELERSRLAQDLHDGVIQDLTGLSYAIPAMAAQLPDHLKSPRRVLDQVGDILQRDVAALRQLLTDIYPADLDDGGLVAEVDVLAERAGERGVTVDARIDPAVADVSLDVSRLAYRIVREGLRNVVSHARAENAWVRADLLGDLVVVVVEDDGHGITRDLDHAGHVGLKLLGETIRRLGGTLTLSDVASGGAVLTATFPADLNEGEHPGDKENPRAQDLPSGKGTNPDLRGDR